MEIIFDKKNDHMYGRVIWSQVIFITYCMS